MGSKRDPNGSRIDSKGPNIPIPNRLQTRPKGPKRLGTQTSSKESHKGSKRIQSPNRIQMEPKRLETSSKQTPRGLFKTPNGPEGPQMFGVVVNLRL